jgi:hypothetical protein
MIELTRVQYKAICLGLGIREEEIENTSAEDLRKVDILTHALFDSLTKDQIKQLAEQSGMSCLEWVEYDWKNRGSHPHPSRPVLVSDGFCTRIMYFDPLGGDFFDEDTDEVWDKVTHWAYIPTPPRGQRK